MSRCSVNTTVTGVFIGIAPMKPVFMEEFTAESVRDALLAFGQVVIVLDGTRDLGKQYVDALRVRLQMRQVSFDVFGNDPYIFAFDEEVSDGQVQYVIHMGGTPDQESRRILALASLRQWCDEYGFSKGMTRLKESYLSSDSRELMCVDMRNSLSVIGTAS